MARHLRAQLEAEADRKGLSGERKQAYIGGAYQRITHHGQRRPWWIGPNDQKFLSRLVGDVHELHHSKERPNVVVFRQGENWYELPLDEYHDLVKYGRQLHQDDEREERDERKRQRRENAAIRLYNRELEREQRAEQVRAARAQRAEQRARSSSEAQLRALHRAEYRDAVSILKGVGGVNVERSHRTGKARDASEYARLPSTIRTTRGGVTPDYAREAIMEHMPWLQLDTVSDFFDFFEGERTYKQHHRRAA